MPAGPHQPRFASAPAAELCVLADDLTGACDAAVAFTGGPQPVRVLLESSALPAEPGGIWAVSTGTRDASPAEARAALSAWAARLVPRGELFKKIDSVFRGNTLLEIITTASLFPADLVVLAPAYPQLGRCMRDGILTVDGAPSLDVAAKLRTRGWQFSLLETDDISPELLQAATLSGPRAVLCDAAEPADLDRVVQAARTLGGRTLWIGSGGLAHALASHSATRTPQAPSELPVGEPIFFIGSDHPATLAQLDHLTHTASEARVIRVERGLTTPADIQAAISTSAPEQPSCLFLTGGDTAQLVCSALGIRSLRLQREFAPGVPLGRAEGGRYDGVAVLLKSGGFGTRELMLDVYRACVGKVEAGFR